MQAWIKRPNANPKPFIWTKTADAIFATLACYCTILNPTNNQPETSDAGHYFGDPPHASVEETVLDLCAITPLRVVVIRR